MSHNTEVLKYLNLNTRKTQGAYKKFSASTFLMALFSGDSANQRHQSWICKQVGLSYLMPSEIKCSRQNKHIASRQSSVLKDRHLLNES